MRMEIVIIAQEITRKESVCFLGSVPVEIIGKAMDVSMQ